MKHFRGNERVRFFSLIGLLAMIIVFRNVPIFQKNDTRRSNKTAEDALMNSIELSDLAMERTQPLDRSKSSSSMERRDKKIMDPPSSIAIYLTDLSSLFSLDYIRLASIWDRSTNYEDFLESAIHNETLPSHTPSADSILRENLKDKNITVIFHNSPKTASSTLREACLEVQYDTCNLPRKPNGMKWPEGYRTSKRLTQLFHQCPNTHHFCVRGLPLSKNYTNSYNFRTFLHLFPFRNYDEWALSALKQISTRDGEEGCREAEELVTNQCLNHRYELNFERYTKYILAEFVKSIGRVQKRTTEIDVKSHHQIFLHNYLHLDETMEFLANNFGVPLLPGTERKINTATADVQPCREKEKILQKFHDCFSHGLAELH